MPESTRTPDPSLINDDIKPTPPQERTWSVMSIASLWVGMVVCVPAYMLAADLVVGGMSWWQSVLTVMLGNLIILVPMMLNGHPGTKYGLAFPVLARASFGILGAHIPSVMRALVACGWFGINTWIGGKAIYGLLNVMTGDALTGAPIDFLDINAGQFMCFIVFWAVQVGVVWRGVESIRLLEQLAAPFLIVMGIALFVWAWVQVGDLGTMFSGADKMAAEAKTDVRFFASLTAMVGFWATLSLNIPDFTRYAKSQRDQVMGQLLGLVPTMTLFAFIGVGVTSATVIIYGEPIRDPTDLIPKMESGWAIVLSLLALTVATLSTNVAANVVSPANVFVNLNPQRISFRMGGVFTAALGFIIMPWKLMAAGHYVFTWLLGVSALMGPIGAILIVDYFILRKTELDVEELFQKQGKYTYKYGFNPAAIVAFVLAVLPNVPGFLAAAELSSGTSPFFQELYSYAWFVGFLLGGFFYWALMSFMPPKQVSQ